jgi:cytochrome c-type biogenesis protein CcmH
VLKKRYFARRARALEAEAPSNLLGRDIMKEYISGAAALGLVLLLVGCNTQNAEPPPPKEKPAASKALAPGQVPVRQPPPIEGPTISGTIFIDPKLAEKASPTAILYIVARPPGVRAPVAVERMVNVTFPVNYRLASQHLMGPSGPYQGKVEITARLDKDGFAGPPQPGDIEGTYPKNPVSFGQTRVDITLDKLY